MKRVRLTLHFDDELDIHPAYDLVTNARYLERVRTVNWNVSDPPTTFLFRMRGDYRRFERDLGREPGEFVYELLPTAEDEWYCFFEGRVTPAARALFENFARGSLLTVPPIEWNDDGSSTFTLVGSGADVQAAVAGVQEGVRVEIESVGDETIASDGVAERLSERQREAAEVATELGYYDVPREASCRDVVRELECATTTAAEHLRKAESKVMNDVFGG